MDTDVTTADICRVCRSEGTNDRPLFHPCICTGSIKWIHQECLMQWMRYSRKEYCELCSYRFSFTPIYSPDMPRHLPLRDLLAGLLTSVGTAIKYWLHYTLVAIAWLGIVPVTACRIYRALFAGTLDAIVMLPFEMASMENLPSDIFQGCFVVTCTLFAFAALVWLREQIVHGGGPVWLQRPQPDEVAAGAADPEEYVGARPHPPAPDEDEVAADENAAGDGAAAAAAAAANLADDNNFIPMEWDRAAEEITWERLLGFDGSLIFLEHVFWVISLNTVFIVIFAYAPYHFGLMTLSLFGMRDVAMKNHFNGLITTLIGYCSIGLMFIVSHRIAGGFGFLRIKRILGLCYVVVKVAILSVVEVGILPLICGWWLDICSLQMFDATLKDREANFTNAPGTSLFIHWLIGMVYVYYFASFILLLREILRPGVLWFLRNFNDPDFSPIQEMIHLPIFNHLRKLVISAMIFGFAVLLMVWLPIRILKYTVPTFLPYTVITATDSQVNELSLEMLLLQGILPGLLEQPHTRIWLKEAVRSWCRFISYILDIHSYLLGDETPTPNDVVQEAVEPNAGLGAAHQALLLMKPPTAVQPYNRPAFFPLRLFVLLITICLSMIGSSLIALTVPVYLGRRVMTLWMATPHEYQKLHELYTAASGLYICWLMARAVTLLMSWLPQGRNVVLERLKHWCYMGVKTLIAGVVLFGIIPLLFGLLLEMIAIVPLRVPIHQTPIMFYWHDWALGVLYTKIACAVALMGPNGFLKAAIDRAYRDGIRDLDLTFILKELATPVIITFGLALAVPYVVAHSIVPLFVTSLQLRNLIARRLYPFLLLVCFVCILIALQITQLKKLYEHIKNDKYLVGQRLVNYDHRKAGKNQNVSATTIT